jgi:hypothetical protein
MKCEHCKKTNAILITCKCDKQYCVKHRHPEHHKCIHVEELFKIEKLIKDKINKI